MPIFEYKCQSCDNRFEELVQTSDAPIRCPKCDSEKTAKLLSVFAAGGSGNGGSSLPSCAGPGCGGPGFT